jgi:hypothetical protein
MTWKAEVGSTIMLRSGIGNKEHLHFVLNDPMDFPGGQKNACMLVNATSIHTDRHDPSCVLLPSAKMHRAITGPSYIAFSLAEIRIASELEKLVAINTFRPHDPVSIQFIRHLLNCMHLSPRTSRLHKGYAEQIEKSLEGR